MLAVLREMQRFSLSEDWRYRVGALIAQAEASESEAVLDDSQRARGDSLAAALGMSGKAE